MRLAPLVCGILILAFACPSAADEVIFKNGDRATEDLGDYFLNTEFNVRVSLTDVLFTDFKVIFDYDSTPASGADNKSLKSILGPNLGF